MKLFDFLTRELSLPGLCTAQHRAAQNRTWLILPFLQGMSTPRTVKISLNCGVADPHLAPIFTRRSSPPNIFSHFCFTKNRGSDILRYLMKINSSGNGFSTFQCFQFCEIHAHTWKAECSSTCTAFNQNSPAHANQELNKQH